MGTEPQIAAVINIQVKVGYRTSRIWEQHSGHKWVQSFMEQHSGHRLVHNLKEQGTTFRAQVGTEPQGRLKEGAKFRAQVGTEPQGAGSNIQGTEPHGAKL